MLTKDLVLEISDTKVQKISQPIVHYRVATVHRVHCSLRFLHLHFPYLFMEMLNGEALLLLLLECFLLDFQMNFDNLSAAIRYLMLSFSFAKLPFSNFSCRFLNPNSFFQYEL